jgi:hypothetical protein
MLLHEQIGHLCDSLKLSSVAASWPSLAEQCFGVDYVHYGKFPNLGRLLSKKKAVVA